MKWRVTPRRGMSCHVKFFHVITCHVIPGLNMAGHVMPTSCHDMAVAANRDTPRHVMVFHVMSRHAMRSHRGQMCMTGW